MSLSQRGQRWADLCSSLTIWQVLADLWHPESNPDGFVSLGVAENALMHKEMSEYINKETRISSHSLTYGDGPSGSHNIKAVLARFLNKSLQPAVPITASHLCVTNGVSHAIEHLTNIIADPGDVMLLGRPYYGAFISDMEFRPCVRVERVAFGDVDPFSLDAVAAYASAIESCQAKKERVAGLMLCNPHNPLGRCYPREVIVELMKLCQKHRIHLISDEIYALSVFRTADPSDSNAAVPFTSLATIPADQLIDPALTHVLYGVSKDFGANGLRLGAVISQHSPEVHKALTSVAIHSYSSALAESAISRLFSDDEFVSWYIAENHRRLKRSYDVVVAWADKHNIVYAPGVNAGFFLWVNLGDVFTNARASKKDGIPVNTDSTHAHMAQSSSSAVLPSEQVPDAKIPSPQSDIDLATNEALMQHKVFLASGSAFGSEKPGWFRIVFSQHEHILKEGLHRIEKALGLD